MGWINNSGSARFKFRQAVTVDNSSGTDPAEVTIDLTQLGDKFWNNVETSGFDVVPTQADGVTLPTFDLSGFSQPNRTGTVRISGANLGATAAMYLMWLYYGNTSAADQAGVPTTVGPLTSFVEQGSPSTFAVSLRPESPNTTVPRNSIQKSSTEEVFVWFEVRDLLEDLTHQNNGSKRYEEPLSAVVSVETGGVAQPAMVAVAKQRFVETPRGLFVRAFIQAGTDSVDYTLKVNMKTHVPPETAHRVLTPAVLLFVRDVAE